MAVRRPLCIVSGRQQELPAADISIGIQPQIWTAGGASPEIWFPLGDQRGSTTSAPVNIWLAHPFFVSEAMTLDRLGIVVSGTAAGTINLAIYANDSNNLPSSRLAVVSLDSSSTGFKTGTISLSLTPGIYWAAFSENAAAASTSFRHATATLRISTSDGLLYTGFLKNSGDGTCPDPAPTGLTFNSAASVPQIVARRSA